MPYTRKSSKKSDLKKFRDKLDKVFSIFIRLRDSNNEGYGQCITCNAPRNWKGADCGHFIGRQYMSIRWDEKNAHLQCKNCNGYGQGEQFKYALQIIDRYGQDEIDRLHTKKRNLFKADKFVYEALIKEYEEKIRNLPNYHLIKAK